MPFSLNAELIGATREWARAPQILIGLDFDGTLAPLVDDPSSSRADPAALAALHRLEAIPGVTCAVVSGRAADVVCSLVDEPGWPDGIIIIGSHGAERGLIHAGQFVADELPMADGVTLARIVAGTAPLVDRFPGLRLERKPYSVAVHTRTMPAADARAAQAAAADLARTIAGITVKKGKDVIEFATLSADKGSALLALRSDLDIGPVAFVGDDITDEDAFLALAPSGFTVKVGPGRTSARYRLAGIGDVARWLGLVAELRERQEHIAAAEYLA